MNIGSVFLVQFNQSSGVSLLTRRKGIHRVTGIDFWLLLPQRYLNIAKIIHIVTCNFQGPWWGHRNSDSEDQRRHSGWSWAVSADSCRQSRGWCGLLSNSGGYGPSDQNKERTERNRRTVQLWVGTNIWNLEIIAVCETPPTFWSALFFPDSSSFRLAILENKFFILWLVFLVLSLSFLEKN